jgi:hypothetical protein
MTVRPVTRSSVTERRWPLSRGSGRGGALEPNAATIGGTLIGVDRAAPARGWEARPVAIPEDVDDPSVAKASGRVELPLRVYWSYPERDVDLDGSP